MITVVGRWEEGWLEHRIEYFMWKQLAAAFKVDRIVMVPKSNNTRIPIDQYNTMEEALESCKGTKYFLEPTGSENIDDIEINGDVVFIFGNAMNHNKNYIKENDISVRIETPQSTDIFAVNALAITLKELTWPKTIE